MPGPAARRLRSVLFTPGANERALQKAEDLPADALILDLEDSVAPEAKPQARATVVAAISRQAFGPHRTVAIRVNAIGSEWYQDDLTAVAQSNPTAVLVPKVSTAADVTAVERALDRAGAPTTTQIWVMIENPLAVLNVQPIATASQRLTTLIVGPNDLLKELHAQSSPDRGPLLTSLSLCVLAARAHGRTVLDGVYNDVRDLPGFEAECLQGRALGFDGKTLIHPDQIEPCNRAYAPTQAELDHARRVIAAFDQATAAGKSVALLDGEMIEHLHVHSARSLLARAESLNLLVDSSDRPV